MQHFFVSPSQINGHTIVITGEDVNHIKNVLRMKPDEEISIGNGADDNEYRASIKELKDDEIICDLLFVKEDGVELPVGITLFQGLPKSDKMDTIIQKAVELGAVRIVPVATERAVVQLDAKKAASKKERWQKISEAAAKQSKRAIVPEVTLPITMSEAVNMAASMNAAAIPYELENGMDGMKAFVDKVKSLAGDKGKDKDKEAKPEVAVFIGPEGGFADEEIELAGNAGITPVSLGRRILRTETAGMTVLSILMYALETV